MLLGRTDGHRSSVLVAEVGADLIGFACFRQRPHADPNDHSADLGIVLTDAWQGRGLGGHMLTWLAREALCREITTFTADVLADNRRMVRLVHRIFPDVPTAYAFGSFTFTIDLESWHASLGEKAAW